MPVKICSFCGSLIQEGEMHRLKDFLKTINTEEVRAEIDQKVRDLAELYNCDINCICSQCFMRRKAESVLPREGPEGWNTESAR